MSLSSSFRSLNFLFVTGVADNAFKASARASSRLAISSLVRVRARSDAQYSTPEHLGYRCHIAVARRSTVTAASGRVNTTRGPVNSTQRPFNTACGLNTARTLNTAHGVIDIIRERVASAGPIINAAHAVNTAHGRVVIAHMDVLSQSRTSDMSLSPTSSARSPTRSAALASVSSFFYFIS